MNLTKHWTEGLKLTAIVVAILLVLWTMPEQTASLH
ncbi:MAG: hypothetical protein RLZ44_359 [Pseudomonadota bacterium]|jgi:hypothetical protein